MQRERGRVGVAVWSLALSLAASSPAWAESPAVREARALLAAGRYEAAERVARDALGDTAAAGPDRLLARRLAVEARVRNGLVGDGATRELARGLSTTDAALGPDLGPNLRVRGLVLLESGAHRAAAALLTRATGLLQSRAASDSGELAAALEDLAHAYVWLERYDAALSVADRAVALRETTPGGRSLDLARALSVRGLVRYRRGENGASRRDFERARSLVDGTWAQHPDTARILTLYVDCLWIDGELDQARVAAERAVEIAETQLRTDHPALAAALRRLAIVRFDLGEVRQALSLRRRALAIAEKAYGRNHVEVAAHLNDLTLSLTYGGEYLQARRAQQRGLAIYEAVLPRLHSYITHGVHNLASIATELRDYDEAVRLNRRAVANWSLVMGPNHEYVAWALIGLAEARIGQGRYRTAVPLLERALSIREGALGPDHQRVGRVLNQLAMCAVRLGEHERASQLATRAITIWERSNVADGLAEILAVRAGIDEARRDYDAAQAGYTRAIAVGLPVLGETHPRISAYRVRLAALLASRGEADHAFEMAMRADRTNRAHLRLVIGFLPERQALGLVGVRPRALELAISMPGAAANAAPLLDAVIRNRSLVLDEVAARQRRQTAAQAAALAPLLAELNAASRTLANLAVRGPDPQRPETYRQDVARAQAAKERVEGELAERSTALRRELQPEEIGLERVRAGLGPRTALLSFVRSERGPEKEPGPAGMPGERHRGASYVAFVLRGGSSAPLLVPLGDAATLDASIDRWRRTITGLTTGPELPSAGDEATLRTVGTALRKRVWDPLAGHLEGIDTALIVPDGALNLLPFAALPMETTRYVVDAGPTIHYLSAERDLVAPASARVGRGLLAIGGAGYGEIAADDAARDTGRRSGCGTFDSIGFLPLPAALREAQDVATFWRTLHGGAATEELSLLTGARASEAAFKRLGPGRRHLHVATHGFFLDESCEGRMYGGRGVGRLNRAKSKHPEAAARRQLPDNPLLLSGLALAGANRRFAAKPTDEDGILTAEEVAALDLDGVEWAVLSACNTGIGEIKVGEGVFGLRRAFRVAGARTTIMSLWDVEDRAARAWMRPLYEARLRDKLSTAEAVRHASLSVLRDRRAKRLNTHPFYWAGFVAAGDWR